MKPKKGEGMFGADFKLLVNDYGTDPGRSGKILIDLANLSVEKDEVLWVVQTALGLLVIDESQQSHQLAWRVLERLGFDRLCLILEEVWSGRCGYYILRAIGKLEPNFDQWNILGEMVKKTPSLLNAVKNEQSFMINKGIYLRSPGGSVDESRAIVGLAKIADDDEEKVSWIIGEAVSLFNGSDKDRGLAIKLISNLDRVKLVICACRRVAVFRKFILPMVVYREDAIEVLRLLKVSPLADNPLFKSDIDRELRGLIKFVDYY